MTGSTEAGARRTELVGVLLYVVAAGLFAFNGAVAKLAIGAGLEPLRLVQLRNAGGLIVLAVIVLLFNRQAFRIRKGELRLLISYGVVAFAIVQFLYFFAVSRLPLEIATLLAFLAPVVVALWVKFGQRQPVANRIWLAVVLILAGLALVAQIWHGLRFDALGVLAGFALAIALATYWLIGEAGQSHRDGISLTMWGFFFASVVYAVIAPWWTFPWSVLNNMAVDDATHFPDLPVWAIVLWGVAFGTVIPFLFVLGSIKRIGAQRASLVATTEPIWAAILGLLVLGEVLAPVQILGAAIVLAGIIVAETARRANEPDEFLLTPV